MCGRWAAPKIGACPFHPHPATPQKRSRQLSSTGAIGAVVPIANDDNARLVFQAV